MAGTVYMDPSWFYFCNLQPSFFEAQSNPRIFRIPRRKGNMSSNVTRRGGWPLPWYMSLNTFGVQNRTVHGATNKRMFHPSDVWKEYFLFILDTHVTTYNIACNIIRFLCKKRPLTWNGCSAYVVVNPHPCWSLAQCQLPHFKIPPAPTLVPSSPSFCQYK